MAHCGGVDLKIWVVVHVQSQSWLSFAIEIAESLLRRNRWAAVENEVKLQLRQVVESSEFRNSYPKHEEMWVNFWSDDHFEMDSPAIARKRKGKELEVGTVTFPERFVRKLGSTSKKAAFLKKCVLLQFVSAAKQDGNFKFALWLEKTDDLSGIESLFNGAGAV